MVSTGEARTVDEAMEHIRPIAGELTGSKIFDLEILNRPDVPEMTPERLAEVVDAVSEEHRMRVVAGTVQSKKEMQALLHSSQSIVGIVTPAGTRPFDWVGEIAASGRLAVVNNPNLSDLSIALNDELDDPPPGSLHHSSRYTVKLSPWTANRHFSLSTIATNAKIPASPASKSKNCTAIFTGPGLDGEPINAKRVYKLVQQHCRMPETDCMGPKHKGTRHENIHPVMGAFCENAGHVESRVLAMRAAVEHAIEHLDEPYKSYAKSLRQ